MQKNFQNKTAPLQSFDTCVDLCTTLENLPTDMQISTEPDKLWAAASQKLTAACYAVPTELV